MSATAADEPTPWYETSPERVEWELEQFTARGLPAERRMGLSDGRLAHELVIATELPFRGETVAIEVAFPFDYPDKGPTFFGPLGLLDRHQQPRDGNFCWAEDHDAEWWPGTAAAQLVDEDIRRLLEDSERGTEAVREGEADMPEPVTGHMHYGTGVVVVPDPFLANDLQAGEGNLTLLGTDPPYFVARAAGIGSADAALQEFFVTGVEERKGYWVDLSPAPTASELDSASAVQTLIAERVPRLLDQMRRRLKQAKSLPSVNRWLGVTFLEEGPVRGEYRRNWVFAEVGLDRGGALHIGQRLRAQALTLDERQRRTPELIGLGDTRVLLIGAGSLGAPTALELAKAGVGQLDIVDPDAMDVNNSVRHIAGPALAGLNKASITAVRARSLNPFVTVTPYSSLNVGAGSLEAKLLVLLVERATVVVDTTGSQAVARILQRACREHGKPLVVAGLTAGSYGGEVALLRPGGACFDCLLLAQQDGTVPEPDKAPPSALVTPIGCSHPAFSGAGFDATEIAALTARTVVQATGASSYPPLSNDWTVVNFRSEPRSESGTLDRHPKCSRCP